MGAEVTCKLRMGKGMFSGKALLETDFLLFRGDERVKIAFSEIRAVAAKDGVLVLTLAKGTAALELGPKAAAWAEKIARPKGIVDKLGVKTGAKVALVGAFADGFVADVRAAGAKVTAGARGADLDHVLFAAESAAELTRTKKLASLLAAAGGLWIVYPKGQAHIREADVLGAGRAAGLKDVKVARFSDTHTALRFVVPVAERRGR